MSAPRRHPIDREAAERLVSAYERGGARYPVRGVSARDHDPLADLLAAAAVASPADPASEEAAVAAFRAAGVSVPQAPGRRSALARMLTLPFAMALAGAAAGGLALAASTGVLPTPLHPGTAPAPTVTLRPTTPARASTQPGASAAASTLLGLCEAYDRWVGPERGRALDTPAFGDLVVAAGGKGNVDHFCADLADLVKGAAELPTKGPSSHTPNPHASRTPARGTGNEHAP